MSDMRSVILYTDYKSPYAYLAKDLAYELERDFPVRLTILPYVLDIPSFLGSARVDAEVPARLIENETNGSPLKRVNPERVATKRWSPFQDAVGVFANEESYLNRSGAKT